MFPEFPKHFVGFFIIPGILWVFIELYRFWELPWNCKNCGVICKQDETNIGNKHFSWRFLTNKSFITQTNSIKSRRKHFPTWLQCWFSKLSLYWREIDDCSVCLQMQISLFRESLLNLRNLFCIFRDIPESPDSFLNILIIFWITHRIFWELVRARVTLQKSDESFSNVQLEPVKTDLCVFFLSLPFTTQQVIMIHLTLASWVAWLLQMNFLLWSARHLCDVIRQFRQGIVTVMT